MCKNNKNGRTGIMRFIISPYILYSVLAGMLVLWLFFVDNKQHLSEVEGIPSEFRLSEPLSIKSPEPDGVMMEYPSGTSLKLYGRTGTNWIVEDENGIRRIISAPKDDSYSFSSGDEGLNTIVNSEYALYVSAKNTDDVLVGENINDVIRKYGDYTEANTAKGYYYFKQIHPLIGRVRYESGISLSTDSSGIVIASAAPENSYTTSNLFGYLPFYNTICSWNLANRAFNRLIQTDMPVEEQSKGFLNILLGLIWGFVWGCCKIVIALVFLFLVFVIPASVIVSVTGPMVYIKTISTKCIMYINLFFTIPLEYILLISMTDYCHQVWWIAFPIFVFMAAAGVMIPINMTMDRRCPKCGEVDTREFKRTVLDVREKSRLEEDHYESETAKHKYNYRKMRNEWLQDTYTKLYRITETEKDIQTDWVCKACGATGTSVHTERTSKREHIETDRGKNVWVKKH